MIENIIKEFKGGSLSSTLLIKDKQDNLFVRKTVSLIENREYGFQRWYSQLKRIQRYNILFPELFPKLLDYGKNKNIAYMDIEYFQNGINAHEYIVNCKSKNDIDIFFKNLINSMQTMYKRKIVSSKNAINLYLNEEIDQRLNDCLDTEFKKFLNYEKIIFNGIEVVSFIKQLNIYKELCQKYYTNYKETFTHGNITLENLLYLPELKRVIFIDPYEENIIDSELAEFSQLLQSSNSKYEIYNHIETTVKDNIIESRSKEYFGLNYFNSILLDYLKHEYSSNDYIMIKLFEISQFIRMLPFKLIVDRNKMIFFYGLASYLFHNLMLEINTLKDKEIINEER